MGYLNLEIGWAPNEFGTPRLLRSERWKTEVGFPRRWRVYLQELWRSSRRVQEILGIWCIMHTEFNDEPLIYNGQWMRTKMSVPRFQGVSWDSQLPDARWRVRDMRQHVWLVQFRHDRGCHSTILSLHCMKSFFIWVPSWVSDW